MVNFGALPSFAPLHLAVMWFYMRRKHSTKWLSHAVLPFGAIGFTVNNVTGHGIEFSESADGLAPSDV